MTRNWISPLDATVGLMFAFLVLAILVQRVPLGGLLPSYDFFFRLAVIMAIASGTIIVVAFIQSND